MLPADAAGLVVIVQIGRAVRLRRGDGEQADFRRQREVLLQQIDDMRRTLETVEYKCWFYETAQAAGTVDIPSAMAEEEIPERFRAIRRELRSGSGEDGRE